MEHHEEIDQEKGLKEPFQKQPCYKSLGGVKTLPFILANEAIEKTSYYGLHPNMILYLMGNYGLEMTTAANISFLWAAASGFLTILAAFLADASFGRFRMMGIGALFAVLGMLLLWTTTIIPAVNPSTQQTTINSNISSTTFQLIYLCFALGLMSIGSGGIRSSCVAFGADQLSTIGDDGVVRPGSSRSLEGYFSWYYATNLVGAILAMTCLVYIQDHLGWTVGFAIPALLMLVSTICFFSASPLYLKIKPVDSVFTRLVQVVVATWRNRRYELPRCSSFQLVYLASTGSSAKVPTEKLRFLNKACIVKNHQQDVTRDGMPVDPWRLCTIDQVEDIKAIINVIPLWSTAILLGANTASIGSFLVVQAKYMDRHFLTSSFEIPPASFGIFALISVLVWLVFYNRVIIPLVSKFMGKDVRMDAITRTGVCILLSFACTVMAGFVEKARRASINPISAMWLVPVYCLLGLSEGIVSIAHLEFFYSKCPQSVSSIATNLFGLSMSISGLVSSFIVSFVNNFTKQGGNESWISSNPNKGHYDYFYWLMSGFTAINYIYFLVCRKRYREKKRVTRENMNFIN